MGLNKRTGPMNQEESAEHKELYKQLKERVKELRTNLLFEEPCPLYEPGWEDVTNSADDWTDFWENEYD